MALTWYLKILRHVLWASASEAAEQKALSSLRFFLPSSPKAASALKW